MAEQVTRWGSRGMYRIQVGWGSERAEAISDEFQC